MKSATVCKKQPYVPYPNAATRQQMIQKLVDGLLMAACGMGIAVMVVFSVALS